MPNIRSLTSGNPRILMALALTIVLFGCAAKDKSTEPGSGESGAATSWKSPARKAQGGSLSILDASSEYAHKPTASVSDDAFEDYGDETSEQISDPLEGWNRFWFRFNDVLLLDIIKPVYTGYAYVTPEDVRTGMGNVLYNLQAPIRLTNSLLQGKVGQAWVELGRFMINTTAGMGGVFDVARQSKPRIPVDDRGADFGQTLATWGIGEGIYLVWPILGPSTARDTVGTAGDLAASPFFWLVEPIGSIASIPAMSTDIGLRFNDMGKIINAYEAVTKGAIEPYIAARDAYVKYRRAGVLRGRTQW